MLKSTLSKLIISSLLVGGTVSTNALAETDVQPTQQALTRISLNSADASTLAEHLVGIGPAKAQAIVDWRKNNGRFTSIEQLLEIKGIGESTLNKNKDRMTL